MAKPIARRAELRPCISTKSHRRPPPPAEYLLRQACRRRRRLVLLVPCRPAEIFAGYHGHAGTLCELLSPPGRANSMAPINVQWGYDEAHRRAARAALRRPDARRVGCRDAVLRRQSLPRPRRGAGVEAISARPRKLEATAPIRDPDAKNYPDTPSCHA